MKGQMRRAIERRWHVHRLALTALLLPAVLGTVKRSNTLPFASGERLVFHANAGRGLNGRAEMWIDGPVDMHGTQVLVLNSEVKGGFGPIKVSDRTTSWFDPERMAILRFQKDEWIPFGHHSESVDISADGRAWRNADGRVGATLSDQPLDELSFIFVLRTLRMESDSVITLNRHFDPERNPTVIHALGAGSVKTDAGTFVTRDYEMRVHDTRRYRGDGIIRISLSDDACRRPVRIESRIPGAGRTVVLELISAELRIADCPIGDERDRTMSMPLPQK
jgi:hypothetical protein